MPATAPSTTALPVHLAVSDAAVARHVEGVLGWQVVAADDQLVRPRVAVVDAAAAAGSAVVPGSAVGPPSAVVPGSVGSALLVGPSSTRPDRPPTVLLVAPGDDPVVVAQAARGADAVVAWPRDADRLAEVVAALIDRPIDRPVGTPALAIGAAAGGVGATTVALGVAALAAWDLRLPTLALVTGWSPVPAAPTVTGDDLEAPSLWNTAAPAPGLADLRVARLSAPLAAHAGSVAIVGPARVVVESSVGIADLLVARPDAAGRDVVAASSAGTIVLVGDGPVPTRDLVRVAGGRRLVTLGHDPRIPRAAVGGRVPADLPGRWLDTLRGALG